MSRASEPSRRDIILVGGSAGSIDALLQILPTLPPDFAASFFIVVHTPADGPGLLPRIIRRATALPTVHPADGDNIRPGHIYVAPPNRHLTLAAGGVIHVSKGARENGHRPAIDPLFRTAAIHGYAPRAIAVILSGYLDDGSAGLYAVRSRGGVSIIQDPKDAIADPMPGKALQYAGADFVLPARNIGAALAELVGSTGKVIAMKDRDVNPKHGSAAKSSEDEGKDEITSHRVAAYPGEGGGMPSVFACPDCHGVLWEIKEGGSVRYRCRVGHAYSEATLSDELSQAAESALWAAMRALDEKAGMARRMADAAAGPEQWTNRLREQAETYADQADMLRKMILGEPPVAAAVVPESRDEAS
ncbi:MAG: chemotaxis protein CheB [Acidobacteria bacterium]|nr:chemotaxis protein CheB [Acidobacteriota bacterium]